MELRHLRYFVAVAEELSFRGAADRLHLAQPSLSRQIRDLEEEVGERLFDRNRQRVLLTDAGRALLDEARGILTSADNAVRLAREVGRGVRGVLRIGNTARLSAPFLPASLAAFRAQFPLVDIEISELDPDAQTEALLAGTIQVGLRGQSSLIPWDERLATRDVFAGKVIVAVPSGHALAKVTSVALKDLANETFLMFRPTDGVAYYEGWMRAACHQIGGFTPKVRRPGLPNWEAVYGMVAAGNGIILRPIFGPSDSLGWVGLVAKPLRAPKPDFRVAAVWNPDNLSVVLRNYLEILAGWKVPRLAG